MKCQMGYMESIKMLEKKWMLNQQKNGKNGFTDGSCSEEVLHLLNSVLFYVQEMY